MQALLYFNVMSDLGNNMAAFIKSSIAQNITLCIVLILKLLNCIAMW